MDIIAARDVKFTGKTPSGLSLWGHIGLAWLGGVLAGVEVLFQLQMPRATKTLFRKGHMLHHSTDVVVAR